MRQYILLFSVLTFFVIGCSQESDFISPSEKIKNEPNWIALPKAEGMQVNVAVSASKMIDGSKGGRIDLDYSFSGGVFGYVTLTSSLVFPKDSHKGKITFTVTHDDSECVSTFGPSFVFKKPLTLNVKYTGIDLSGINPSTVKFAYLAIDGSVEYALNDGIIVDLLTGTLEVKNAKIPHFSRYGFVN